MLAVVVIMLSAVAGLPFLMSFPAAESGRHVVASAAVAGGSGGYRAGREGGVREAGVAAYPDP